MLHKTNNIKGAVATDVMIWMMIGIAVVLVVYLGVLRPLGKGGTHIGSYISPATDYKLCLTASRAHKVQLPIGETMPDIDNDQLADNICDNCVCKEGCKNMDKNDDQDLDGLPDLCDAFKDKYEPSNQQKFNDKCENIKTNLRGDPKNPVWQCKPTWT